jgi:hypothetical protein
MGLVGSVKYTEYQSASGDCVDVIAGAVGRLISGEQALVTMMRAKRASVVLIKAGVCERMDKMIIA